MDRTDTQDSCAASAPNAAASKRYTTMEGWRPSRASLHAAAGIGLKIFAPAPQFAGNTYLDADDPLRTRSSKRRLAPDGLAPLSPGTSWMPSPLTRGFPASYSMDSVASPERGRSVNYGLYPSGSPVSPQDSLSAGAATPPDVEEKQQKAEEPYHLFTHGRKWFVVITIGMAGMFSGLSSNIYFPSLDAIAKDLNVSLASVSLTITSYLIIQGISPLIWGSLSDALGRRPIYIASFSIYILANVALSFSPNFAVLLIFRGLQAAGSASTVSIGNGVIQDISPPEQRGAFISFYQAIRNFSIAVGPVLGGAFANSFGFRSIFIFLTILSALVLLDIFAFLPETMRSITGNGSVRVTGIYKPWVYAIKGEPSYVAEPDEPIIRKKITAATFLEPLKLLVQKDVLLNLLFGGVVYTIWSMVTASTTTLFKENFHLNELMIGLAYLPNGLGTIVGSAIVGNLMTKDFKTNEEKYKLDKNLPDTYKLPAKNIPADFPIEKARLRHLPWISIIFVITTGIYGFAFVFPHLVKRTGWIAVPLTLQFFIAAASNAVFALNQTLVSDLCPGKGASATAMNNLVRCSLGAVGVAVIEMMIAKLGPDVAFLVLGLTVVGVSPLAWANLTYGMRWRAERMAKNERREDERNKARGEKRSPSGQ